MAATPGNTFPTSLNNYPTGVNSYTLFNMGHVASHNAYEAKIGIGASTPVASRVLRGTGTGTSAWAQIVLTTDVTGTLPLANGGTGGTTSTGSGALVLATTPTLITPILGVATATSLNKLTITAPATSAVLTILDGKTLTVNNTITLAGTDGTTITFQGTDTYVGRTTTDTLTNKRVTKRVSTTASSTTPTPNADTDDFYTVTALAAGATFGAPTGTPTNGQTLIIRVKDNATARTLAFNAIYRFSTDLPAPTTTVISKTLYLGFVYNSADTKWDCLALLGNI